MKKIILTLIPALCVTLATAQPPRGERPSRSREENQKLMEQRTQKRNAELRETLSLSDAVAHKVDSVNAEYDRQLQALTPTGEGRRGARPDDSLREKIQHTQKAREAEVKKHLSKEQQAKYDKWLKESQQREPAPGGKRPR
jgi:iron-sulfur cluster repair protein YtfE (RIC family)